MNTKKFLIEKIVSQEVDPAYARRARIILSESLLELGENLLEIGCGRGFYIKNMSELFPDNEIVGIDLKDDYLKIAKESIKNKKVKLLKADATKLPFADKSFDKIIASEILEHIDNEVLAIKEMRRVLKDKGTIVITVPNKNFPFNWDPINWILQKLFKTHLPANIWWLSGIWAGHVRLYSKEELVKKLETEKFKVEKIWGAVRFCLPFSHFIFYGIGKNIVELGLMPSMNRFKENTVEPIYKKILLWPIRQVDSLNKDDELGSEKVSNIILKISKEN